MQKWEYLMVFVYWNDALKTYTTPFNEDLVTASGFPGILNKYGDLGWELVNVAPTSHEAMSTAPGSTRAVTYYCFFKRPQT